MPTTSNVFNDGVRREDSYGYSQGFRAGDTVHISRQLAHDADCNLVGRGDITAQATKTFETSTPS